MKIFKKASVRVFVLILLIFLLAGCSSDEGLPEVDIDLTEMSVTMVNAQVMQMMMNPENYHGQTVRVRGSHFPFFWPHADVFLHYVVLDLTAGCCGGAFEFILSDELAETTDYLPHEAVIEITGVFDSYELMGHVFNYIRAYAIKVESGG